MEEKQMELFDELMYRALETAPETAENRDFITKHKEFSEKYEDDLNTMIAAENALGFRIGFKTAIDLITAAKEGPQA